MGPEVVRVSGKTLFHLSLTQTGSLSYPFKPAGGKEDEITLMYQSVHYMREEWTQGTELGC